MTRRVTIGWPDPAPFAGARRADGGSLRLLAVSDDREPALEHAINRERLGPVDLIVGCGDLESDYLAFLGDAFCAPLVYVRGNHDHGAAWDAHERDLPEPLPDGAVRHEEGLPLVGFSWPSRAGGARPGESAAWTQVARLGRRLLRPPAPLIVLSHVPPRGAGDVDADPYHVGFEAYRWLAKRLQPSLWLHGHTPVAGVDSWRMQFGATTCLNVTGAVLVELVPESRKGVREA